MVQFRSLIGVFLIVVAAIFIIAATATPGWGKNNAGNNFVAVRVGMFQSCTYADSSDSGTCHSVSDDDVKNFCSNSNNNTPCNEWRTGRAFSVLACAAAGISALLFTFAAGRGTASHSHGSIVMCFITGCFALIAFAVGADFVNNQLGTSNGYSVDYSIGLMVIGWVLSWAAAAAGGIFNI